MLVLWLLTVAVTGCGDSEAGLAVVGTEGDDKGIQGYLRKNSFTKRRKLGPGPVSGDAVGLFHLNQIWLLVILQGFEYVRCWAKVLPRRARDRGSWAEEATEGVPGVLLRTDSTDSAPKSRC